jgi:hypothetical protein
MDRHREVLHNNRVLEGHFHFNRHRFFEQLLGFDISSDCFFDIFKSLVPGVALRDAAGQGGNCHRVAAALVLVHENRIAHSYIFHAGTSLLVIEPYHPDRIKVSSGDVRCFGCIRCNRCHQAVLTRIFAVMRSCRSDVNKVSSASLRDCSAASFWSRVERISTMTFCSFKLGRAIFNACT